MGKSEKTGLGCALVRHHDEMVQQFKEKRILESVTEVADIDAVTEQADRVYAVDNLALNLLIINLGDVKLQMQMRRARARSSLHHAKMMLHFGYVHYLNRPFDPPDVPFDSTLVCRKGQVSTRSGPLVKLATVSHVMRKKKTAGNTRRSTHKKTHLV